MQQQIESILPDRKQWQLVWNDEFNADSLDESKWSYRTHMMHSRHNTFAESGAELDGNGNLLLPLIEKDGHYYAPHLQTGYNFMDNLPESYGGSKLSWPIGKIEEPKFMHKYGYYECRCKLPEQPGWWAAFWLQSPIIGATMNPEFAGVEVDIMENFTRDGIISHNNHWNGYGSQHKHVGSGSRQLKDTEDGFHVFGLEWSRDGYSYYVDGELSWRVSGPVSDCEQFILISAECMGYRGGNTPAPELKKAVLPDAFIVDYVRVFDEIEPVEKIYWRDEKVACYIYHEEGIYKASVWNYGDSRGLELILGADIPEGMDAPLESCLKVIDKATFITYRGSDLAGFVTYLQGAEIRNTVPLLPADIVRVIPSHSGPLCMCALKNDSAKTLDCQCEVKGQDFRTEVGTGQIEARLEQSLALPVKGDTSESGPASVELASGDDSWSFKVECQAMNKICRTDGSEYGIPKSIKRIAAEHKASFSITREDDFLNFHILVQDKTPSGAKGGRPAWEQDSIELFFDPAPGKMPFAEPASYHDDMLRFFILPYLDEDEQVEVMAGYERIFRLTDIELKREILEDGYLVDFKIPMKKLNFEFSPENSYLGFDIAVNDADGAEKANSTISWSSEGDAHINRFSMDFLEII